MARQRNHDVLPKLFERELRRQQRPERVTVRVLVRRYEEAIVRAKGLDDRSRIIRLRRAHR